MSTPRYSRPSALRSLLLSGMFCLVFSHTEWLQNKVGDESHWIECLRIHNISEIRLLFLCKSTLHCECDKSTALADNSENKSVCFQNHSSGSRIQCRQSSSVDTREECWLRSCILYRCTSQIRYRRRPWMSSSRSRFRYIWRDITLNNHKSKLNLDKPKWRTSCSYLDLHL